MLELNPALRKSPNSLSPGQILMVPGAARHAPKVAVANKTWELGSLSTQYETGGRGPTTVSTGVGDAGGVSYGSYQMTSKNGGTDKTFV